MDSGFFCAVYVTSLASANEDVSEQIYALHIIHTSGKNFWLVQFLPFSIVQR